VALTTTVPGQDAGGPGPGGQSGAPDHAVGRPSDGSYERAAGLFGWPAVALVSALATLFSWKTSAWPRVSAGVNSWEAALPLAFVQHLQWGPQAVFTFGPYGFVENLLPFSHLTAGLGLLYALAIAWGLAALIVSRLRQDWGLLLAGVVAWAALGIAANLLEAPELALATALGLALASFRAPGIKTRLALLGCLGALAGFQLLVEINVGLVTTALLVLAVAGAPHGRAQAALAGAVPFVAVPTVALVSAGQSLGNVASYVRGSLSVALGYGSAMSLSTGRQAENWYALVDVALLVGIFVLALRGRPVLEKVAVSLVLAAWGWEALKEGFVRHDTHDLTFFALVLLALCLARLPRSLPLMGVQAGAITVAALLACISNGHPPPSLRSPVEDVTSLATEVKDLAVPGQWAAVEDKARDQIRATGDYLPPAVVPALRGQTLAAETLEDAMTFAYPGLRWDPEPVLQSYSAYTAYLDHLDANFLSSSRAPERILYDPVTINNRDPWWEPPATIEAMYCHYRQIGPVGKWLLLARVGPRAGTGGSGAAGPGAGAGAGAAAGTPPGAAATAARGAAPSRCGVATVIGETTAHFGQPVSVPAAPGKMVVATFSLNSPLTARAESLALKGPEVDVTAWDSTTTPSGGPETYRFVPGTAGDAHVLAVPRTLGYLPAFTPPAVRKLEFTGGGWAPGQGSVHVTFYSVPLRRQ
jgi:hypothetical protein